jgi:hypothetical protein
VKAAKAFAYKISASFRRQTKFVKQKYRQKFRQLEEKFLNASQGEAGLIFAVHDTPSSVVQRRRRRKAGACVKCETAVDKE